MHTLLHREEPWFHVCLPWLVKKPFWSGFTLRCPKELAYLCGRKKCMSFKVKLYVSFVLAYMQTALVRQQALARRHRQTDRGVHPPKTVMKMCNFSDSQASI